MRIYFLLFLSAALLSSCQNNTNNKNGYSVAQNMEPSSPQDELAESITRGAEIYKDFCVRCHRPKGKGMGKSFPPLAGSDYLLNNREESIRAVKFGQQGEIIVNGKTYNNVMAPMGLEDDEVADVMNYILNSWENREEKMVTEAEVAAVEK